jgi:hypothetical protein
VNRREVLTGMALASAATVIPAAATAASNVQPDRAAWDRAMAALNCAKAEADAFDDELWRIDAAYHFEADQVPHVTVEKYGRTISTANRDEVAWARSGCKSLRYVETCAYEGAKADQQLVDAADARDAKLKAIDKRLGYGAAHDHNDALTDAIVEAEEVLLNMPAPDGEALLWKVNRLYPEGEGIWEAGYEAQTQADLRRFLSTGRA